MINEDRCETDDSEYSKDIVDVEITFGTSVLYDCRVEVETFRNVPCNTEVVQMERVMLDSDGDGKEMDRMRLALEDYPHYIKLAAEKKALEMS